MKKTSFIAIALAVAIGIGSIGIANAYNGDPTKKGPLHTPEREAQLNTIFANKDYTAWKNLMGDSPITQKITSENFDEFIKARSLMLEGKVDEAKEIRKELGIGNGQIKHLNGMMRGQKQQGNKANGGFVDANNDGICDHKQ